MDRYLNMIEEESKSKKLLSSKKKQLLDEKYHLECLKGSVDCRISRLEEDKEIRENQRMFQLNKKSILKEFFKDGLKFGLKSTLLFDTLFILLMFLQIKMEGSMDISIINLIKSNGAFMCLFGGLEWYKNMRSVDFGGKSVKNIDRALDSINKELEEQKGISLGYAKELDALKALISEVNESIGAIDNNIASMNQSRDMLIKQLTDNLDDYIEDFSYEKTEIEGVQKKITMRKS